jgi:peptide/nickel transport system permease protein
MNLLAYLVRRMFGIIAVLLGVSIITFSVSHLVPADPVLAALGDKATAEQIAAFRHQYGLDRPVPEQYVVYLEGLLHGDLGTSIRTRQPVIADLRDAFPATCELALAALLVSLVIGIPAGVWAAVRRNQWPDHVVRVLAVVGGGMPIFWLGLIMIGLFYYQLNWLPGGGRIDQYIPPPRTISGMYVPDSLLTGDWPALFSSLEHLALPAFVLGYYSTAVITRMMRSSMLEVLGQDYLRTARSKGLRQRAVVLRHALRNALIPTTTIVGVTFGSLLSGAVLTEPIFGWSGLGRYATQSAVSLDFPAVMGVTLLAAVVYAVANLLVDLTYYILDPRIQHA